MLKFIKSLGVCLLGATVTLIIGVLLAFIAFNAVTTYSSFWLGFGGVFGLVFVLLAFYWASHPSTRQWPGTFIGFGTAMIMIAMVLLWKPFENFSFGDFGWGLLALFMVVGMTAAIYGTHLWLNKITHKS